MSSCTIVDDISDDIGRITLSKDNCNVTSSKISSSSPEEVTSTKKCTSCEQNLEHNIKTKTDDDVSDSNSVIVVCANCGKEGASNTCNKCNVAKYCNAACKKKHRSKHKKDCEEHRRLAVEHADKLRDILLFEQPPPAEDCPLCFLRMPDLVTGRRHQSCCGKLICSGCVYASFYDHEGSVVAEETCPFCRTPQPTSSKEIIEMTKKRVEAGDAESISMMGSYFAQGLFGFPQDYSKALELWYQAGELGCAAAYLLIAQYLFMNVAGRGEEMNEENAHYYYDLAAMGGDTAARHNVGCMEASMGNMDKAVKHWMISARGGMNKSVKKIKQLYTEGHVTKEDYTAALRFYQTYLGEIKSAQRDKAAAAHDQYRYY